MLQGNGIFIGKDTIYTGCDITMDVIVPRCIQQIEYQKLSLWISDENANAFPTEFPFLSKRSNLGLSTMIR